MFVVIITNISQRIISEKPERFIAFTLPGGKDEAEEYIRGTGFRKFSKRIGSLGKYHCEMDARKASDDCINATGGVYGAPLETGVPALQFD